MMSSTTKPYLLVWAFISLFAEGCKEVFQPSLDHKNVTLVAPGNNIPVDSGIQTFYWQPVDTGAINYELVIVSPRFDSAAFLAADTTINTNKIFLSLNPGAYQWKVRAFNSVSSTVFSAPWTVIIK